MVMDAKKKPKQQNKLGRPSVGYRGNAPVRGGQPPLERRNFLQDIVPFPVILARVSVILFFFYKLKKKKKEPNLLTNPIVFIISTIESDCTHYSY